MEFLLISAVPVVGAGMAFLVSVSVAILMFSLEAWVTERLSKCTLAARISSGRGRRG